MYIHLSLSLSLSLSHSHNFVNSCLHISCIYKHKELFPVQQQQQEGITNYMFETFSSLPIPQHPPAAPNFSRHHHHHLLLLRPPSPQSLMWAGNVLKLCPFIYWVNELLPNFFFFFFSLRTMKV